jgi:hypothetical protein
LALPAHHRAQRRQKQEGAERFFAPLEKKITAKSPVIAGGHGQEKVEVAIQSFSGLPGYLYLG